MARVALDAYQGKRSSRARTRLSLIMVGDEVLRLCASLARRRGVIASAGHSLPILARAVRRLRSLGSQIAEFVTQIVKKGLQGMMGFSRVIEVHGAHQIRGEFNTDQGGKMPSRLNGVSQDLLIIQT